MNLYLSLRNRAHLIVYNWLAYTDCTLFIKTTPDTREASQQSNTNMSTREYNRLNLEKQVPSVKNYESQINYLRHESHLRKDAVFAYVDGLQASDNNVFYNDKAGLGKLKQSLIPTADLTNVLMSIATGAWEEDPKVVREIGISIYDPALQSERQCSFINAHLIVQETVNKCVNKNDEINKYQYGTSIVMPREQIVLFVQSIVDHFFMYRKGMDCVFISHDYFYQLDEIKRFGIQMPSTFKRVDTSYLQRLSMGLKTADTLAMSLRAHYMLSSNIRNAGNSAHYSLLFCMRLCDVNYRKDYGLDDFDARDWFLRKCKTEKLRVWSGDFPSPTKRIPYARDALTDVFLEKYV